MIKTTFGIPNQFVGNCIDSFPRDSQLDILQEECAELIQACSKLKRAKTFTEKNSALNKIKEEMSHVLISSAVTSKLYGIREEDILAEVERKQIKYGFPTVLAADETAKITNIFKEEYDNGKE